MKKNICENKTESKNEHSDTDKVQALELLKSPQLINRFLEICHTQYLGRDKELLLIKLATISRKMRRGVSVIITGTSSVGKSELLGIVLKTVDPEEKFDFTRITPQYLLYTTNSLDHKIVTFFEIAGANETFHLLRTALSEGHLNLGTVQNDRTQGLHSEDKKKSSNGMVMLTTFATGKIDHELDTRLIIIEITHDQELARNVMKLKANQVDVNDHDFKIWQIADQIIEPLEVVIPYAKILAERFPTHEERFMRDFDKLLTLIRASALWHQHQRASDEDGHVIASEEDYKIVYSLRELISQTVSAISQPVKQFIEKIASLAPSKEAWVDREKLKTELGVSLATIKRYVKAASESDYIKTFGIGKKQKLRVIDLPDTFSPLPSPEEIFGVLSEPMSQNEEEAVASG